MTWVIGAFALLVLYVFASIWALRRTLMLEARIMRAHVTLLWRRVRSMNGDAVPVEEIHQELRKLGVNDADAWYWSGDHDLANDDSDAGTPSEVDVKAAQRTASDYYGDMAQRDYLGDEADKKLQRALPLWRMRYARAVLALDELEEQHYRPLRGRNGHDDPIDAYYSLSEDERRRMDDEWAQEYKTWQERYPEAASAKEAMSTEVYREYNEYMAIRSMPEIVEARKRDYERRSKPEAERNAPGSQGSSSPSTIADRNA
jgi:hypothetical protein